MFRVNTKESRETINKFLEKNPSKVPILLDEKNKVGKMMGLWVHPTSFLIDSQGMIRYRAVGGVNWTGWMATRTIDELIGEKK